MLLCRGTLLTHNKQCLDGQGNPAISRIVWMLSWSTYDFTYMNNYANNDNHKALATLLQQPFNVDYNSSIEQHTSLSLFESVILSILVSKGQ